MKRRKKEEEKFNRDRKENQDIEDGERLEK